MWLNMGQIYQKNTPDFLKFYLTFAELELLNSKETKLVFFSSSKSAPKLASTNLTMISNIFFCFPDVLEVVEQQWAT